MKKSATKNDRSDFLDFLMYFPIRNFYHITHTSSILNTLHISPVNFLHQDSKNNVIIAVQTVVWLVHVVKMSRFVFINLLLRYFPKKQSLYYIKDRICAILPWNIACMCAILPWNIKNMRYVSMKHRIYELKGEPYQPQRH